MTLHTAPVSDRAQGESEGVLRRRSIGDLSPHPSLIRQQIMPSTQEVSLAVDRRSVGSREPLTVISEGLILAEVADFQVALRAGDTHLDCFVLSIANEDALLWIIRRHRRTAGISDFNRITLALELEPWFKAKALSNQRLGGHPKASSKLTEADRCDVRSELALAAGVSTGNVSKCKILIAEAYPELIEALRSGELSINKASALIKDPAKQLEAFRLHKSGKGINRVIRVLQSNHLRGVPDVGELNLLRLAKALLDMAESSRSLVLVEQLSHRDHFVVVSSALLKTLQRQGVLTP